MSLSTKVCPFCMVDARTDATSCAYCGSSYDHVAVATPRDESLRMRARTYNGTSHVGDESPCVSLFAG